MSDSSPASPIALDLDGRAAAFPVGVPLGMHLLPSQFITELGMLVAGGPTSLCLFTAVDGEGLVPFATVPAQSWITGFTYHAGGLYVQDGCVLSKWDLAADRPAGATPHDPPVCAAAFNLATGVRCDGAATPAVLQPPDGLASLEQALNQARLREAWATVLDAGEDLANPPGGAADPPGLDDFLRDVRTILGSAHPAVSDPSLVLTEVEAVRRAAETAGAAVVFSPPVVRQNQSASVPAETVFVLGGDGRLHRLDNGLSTRVVVRFDDAALPQLAVYEPADPLNPGSFEMYLVYAAADGTVRMVDASPSPPRLAGSWDAQGAPDPDHVLPFTAVDGLVWGGGLLGSTLFALPPTPPAAAALSVAEPASDWTYAVDADERLAVLTDGTRTRLMSYAPTAVVRDRWGDHVPPAPSWMVFGTPGTPRLLLEIDQQTAAGASGLGFRVYVANTADDPLGVTVFPPPAVVAAGTMAGSPQGPAAVLEAPVVAGGSLYLAGATATLAQQLATLFSPMSDDGSSRWTAFVASLAGPSRPFLRMSGFDVVSTPIPQPSAAQLAAAVPPPAANVAFVCSLAPLADASVTAAATAYATGMATLVGEVALRVYRHDWAPDGPVVMIWISLRGPYALANQSIQVSGPAGAVSVESDGSGLVRLPASWFGGTVEIRDGSSTGTNETGSVALVQGQVNSVTIDVRNYLSGHVR